MTETQIETIATELDQPTNQRTGENIMINDNEGRQAMTAAYQGRIRPTVTLAVKAEQQPERPASLAMDELIASL